MKALSLRCANHFVTPLVVLYLFIYFISPVHSAEVTIAWDPNNEPDLAGYGIYLRENIPGPPYNLAGYVTLNELTEVDNPSFTVSGVNTNSTYYFAITAYDSENLESNFSQSLCVNTGVNNSVCASNTIDKSSGGGGGGGCFINSLSIRASKPGKR
jgi:hypothetical protein